MKHQVLLLLLPVALLIYSYDHPGPKAEEVAKAGLQTKGRKEAGMKIKPQMDNPVQADTCAVNNSEM